MVLFPGSGIAGLAASAACLVACGGLVGEDTGTAGGAFGGGGAPGGGVTGAGGAGAAGDSGLVGGSATGGSAAEWLSADAETFCQHLCTPERIDDVCLGQNACDAARCVQHAMLDSPAVRIAYRHCVEEEPLCFQTVDACILDELWPPGSARRHFELSVTNLPAQANLSVVGGAVEVPQGEPLWAQTVTSNAQVTLSWEWPWSGDFGPIYYVWLDIDADGLCESGTDLFGISGSTWNGSFEAPAYSGVVTEYTDNGAGACPVLGMPDVGTQPD